MTRGEENDKSPTIPESTLTQGQLRIVLSALQGSPFRLLSPLKDTPRLHLTPQTTHYHTSHQAPKQAFLFQP